MEWIQGNLFQCTSAHSSQKDNCILISIRVRHLKAFEWSSGIQEQLDSSVSINLRAGSHWHPVQSRINKLSSRILSWATGFLRRWMGLCKSRLLPVRYVKGLYILLLLRGGPPWTIVYNRMCDLCTQNGSNKNTCAVYKVDVTVNKYNLLD